MGGCILARILFLEKGGPGGFIFGKGPRGRIPGPKGRRAPEGPRRGPGGALRAPEGPPGPRRGPLGPGGAPGGPRRGPRFLATSKSDSADSDRVFFIFCGF